MKKILMFAGMLSLVAMIGAGCQKTPPKLVPITLNYWRDAADPASALTPIIADYRKTHPNINIVVSTFRKDLYETKLIEALAEDRGPDLFSIPNTSLGAFKNKITPLPKQTVVVAFDKPEATTPKKITTKSLTIKDLINQYVGVVADAVVLRTPAAKSEDAATRDIYALPYSVDTLGLFVNADFLKKAGIATPATSWQILQTQAQQMTARDKTGVITIAGAALGTANNTRYFSEILSNLMVQNGANMADEYGYAIFNKGVSSQDSELSAGIEATNFYISFGSSQFSSASWSASLPDSLEAFVAGKSAYAFGLPEDAEAMRQRGIKFNFAVTALPQINAAKPANLAFFPVEVVSKKTKYVNEAWDFIQFASRKDEVIQFLTATKRPGALRAVVGEQLSDPAVGVFANQTLTAQTWYIGDNYAVVNQAFAGLINTLSTSTTTDPKYRDIFGNALGLINATIK